MSAAPAGPGFFRRLEFSGDFRTKSYRRIALKLENGRDVQEVLGSMENLSTEDGRRPSGRGGRVFADVRRRRAGGEQMSEALGPWVPPSHRLLIAASEGSDRLAEGFRACEFLQTASARMRGAVARAVLAVFILVAVVGGMLVGIARFMVPQFAQIVPLEQWQGIPVGLARLAAFMNSPWPLAVVAAMVGFTVLLAVALPRWTGPVRRWLDGHGIEPFRTYRLLNGAGFLMAFASMLGAGANVNDSLRQLAEASNPWLRWKIGGILERLGEGDPPGEAIWHADKRFPDYELNRDLREVLKLDESEAELNRLVRVWIGDAVEQMVRVANLTKSFGTSGVIFLIGYVALSAMVLPQQANQGHIW